MDVQDDGRGFVVVRRSADRDGLFPDGYGLPAMRRRVERLGGRLTVESNPGEGTTVAVEIPLQPAAGSEPFPPAQESAK